MNRLSFYTVLLLTVLSLTVGCARAPKPTHIVRVAILDGAMTPELMETRTSKAGWWMGSHDRWDSGNAGTQLGEALAREFAKLPGVQIYSRTDLAAYMAQKEHALRRAYPDLTPDERRLVLQEQSPRDYGKSLNVDYVVASRITESRTTHNRTFDWWTSHVAFDVEVIDVESGSSVWSWRASDSDLFDSQVHLTEELARSARKRAAKADAFGVLK